MNSFIKNLLFNWRTFTIIFILLFLVQCAKSNYSNRIISKNKVIYQSKCDSLNNEIKILKDSLLMRKYENDALLRINEIQKNELINSQKLTKQSIDKMKQDVLIKVVPSNDTINK